MRLFLSYAREDSAPVEALYDQLKTSGFLPWMDTRNIHGGEDWERSIWRAIREAHFVIFCLSHNSVEKRGFVQKEIKRALEIWDEKLEDDIYLIPVRLEDCTIPPTVERFQCVDLFKPEGLSNLLTAIDIGIKRLGIISTVMPSTAQTTTKEIREESEEFRYSFFASYPQFTPVDSPSVSSLNQIVETFIKDIWDKCRPESIATAKQKHEMKEHLKSLSWDDLSISYSVAMSSSDLFSVQFSIGTYLAGAAHPNSVTRTLNLRKDPITRLSLSNVFRPHSDYLGRLSSYCIPDLEQQAGKRFDPSVARRSPDPWIAKGAGPDYRNFETFVLEPGGLRLFFDPYQVGSHAEGRYEVFVSAGHLAELLDPELAKLLK